VIYPLNIYFLKPINEESDIESSFNGYIEIDDIKCYLNDSDLCLHKIDNNLLNDISSDDIIKILIN
jgi:hypothetical protein